ncbi:hypothetical protein [Polyangium sp. y55x31]|uniref:esterase/lipase family protein n=1 Tax=Polyangium sp. y55x31 TaxID=3042688 RepID=UPI0024828EF2|nr:hypothetical protein [Polyangium sp. y55x31]MDI1482112.1 hypothetical protein [Polyangium sp. y55x31]
MALREVSVGVLVLLLAAACGPTPDPEATGGQGGQGASGGNGPGGSGGGGSGGEGGSVPYPPADAFDPAYDAYFDPPAAGEYVDDYRVVGEITPPSWSWGKIELVEGLQRYRTEGYNIRTQKLRWEDTFEDDTYALKTYFGALNQQLVDGFNIHYKDACAGEVGKSGAPACGKKGPMRPEARFVLLHHGPKTASLSCDKTKTPVVLVHGAMQNGNVWLLPGGDDGAGNAYPGTAQKTGFVQWLEERGHCTYALTFGTFHGDNFNQATNLANVIRRVASLVGQPKVDIVAWSKGVLSADLYLSNVSSWKDWGSKHFERVAADSAKNVPAFRKDVRTYVALSGPHLGIDLNFRHPFNNLIIYSTPDAAPIGQGPVTWGWMSAVQCVTFGYASGPNSIFPNPYAYSACENRGATWPDFWTRIYTSNITGLDAEGKPVSEKSLEALNVAEGVSGADFDFDQYNHAMWGSIDESGAYVSAYLGQLQTAYDLRKFYPLPNRQDDPASYDWSELDTDESKWRAWVNTYKLAYNPAGVPAGWIEDDDAHITCRATSYEPQTSPCKAKHAYYDTAHAEDYSFGYATYTLMDGIGIEAVMEMGGNFIERLKGHGLSPDLDSLYVVHGQKPGAPGTIFEIDGMECPTCDPKGDGVLFDVSIAAQDQLTQGWSADAKASRSKQEGVPFGHLEVGVAPAVWEKIGAAFDK